MSGDLIRVLALQAQEISAHRRIEIRGYHVLGDGRFDDLRRATLGAVLGTTIISALAAAGVPAAPISAAGTTARSRIGARSMICGPPSGSATAAITGTPVSVSGAVRHDIFLTI